MTWQTDAACRGRTETMFAHQRSTAARALCDGCSVRAECAAWAEQVNPTAGRWAGKVWDRLATVPGVHGRIQARIYDRLDTYGPLVDHEGRAAHHLADELGEKRDSVKRALATLADNGVVAYVRDSGGTYRIELADTAERTA